MMLKTEHFQPLEPPPMAYNTRGLSSRSSSTESLSLTTRRISALPLTLQATQLLSTDQTRTRCKQLIMEYKELQAHLAKFPSRSSVQKSNHLRLNLLRFLRLESDEFMRAMASSPKLRSFVVRTAEYGTKVFAQWWSLLVEELSTVKMSNVDRSCYLECVSRLMSRREWRVVKRLNGTYSDQLALTLEYCFNKLIIPLKSVPLSVNAFIGKVFAYCFIDLEHFAPVLLFTLFVKNYTMIKVSELLQHQSTLPTEESTVHPSLLALIDYQGDHTAKLMDTPSHQLLSSPCMLPPRHTTFHDLVINLKDNTWVKKWAGFESDIFASFYKHYTSLLFDNMEIKTYHDLYHCPGFLIVQGHLWEIVESSLQHIKKFKLAQFKDQSAMNGTEVMLTAVHQGTRKDSLQFIAKLPVISVFKVLRCQVFEFEEQEALMLVKTVEMLLKLRAQRVHAYDFQSCEAVYDVFLELCLHLQQENSQLMLRQLDWVFWLTGLVNMIKTGHMISQVKSLCFLFNLWNLLPLDFVVKKQESDGWIANEEFSLVYNLSQWLISKPMWETLFGHWSPLIRHYYQRLVVFKIIGTSNDNYGSYLSFKKTVKTHLNSSYELFKKFVGDEELSQIKRLDLQPALPIVNKKLVISPMECTLSSSSSAINILDSFSLTVPFQRSASSTSTLMLPSNRKIYAYDIFDEAVYTSSSISLQPPGRSRSSTPVSPNMSSSSIARSSSGSTLGKVPLLGTALSFFKRSTSCSPPPPPPATNPPSPGTQSPLPTSPLPESSYEDLKFLRPSPYLHVNSTTSVSSGGSRSPSFVKRSPSMLSSPTSSISELSDEDPDQLLNIPKIRTSAPKSPMSRVSSLSSSTTSIASMNMDTLFSPPELLLKVPEVKRFKYRYHLVFAHAEHSVSKKLRLWRDEDSLEWPRRPVLPFEKNLLGVEDCEDDFLMMKLDEPQVEYFADVKNALLLGKFLNEWRLVVQEYESFVGVLEREGEDEERVDEDKFVDPMLVADIPPVVMK